MASKDWILAEDAAELTGRSVHTIYRWVREGYVRTMRPYRLRFLNRADVMKTERQMITGHAET
jgi:excisionase family DNA binding protein